MQRSLFVGLLGLLMLIGVVAARRAMTTVPAPPLATDTATVTPTATPTHTLTATKTTAATSTATTTSTTYTSPKRNLARNQPAWSSNQCIPNEGPEQAFNDSVQRSNGDKWCSNTGEHVLGVDLGQSQQITHFVISHAEAGGEAATGNTRDFRIETSEDGVTWTSAVEVVSNTLAVTTHYPSAPLQARYVRLNITAPNQIGNSYARIYEFEIYGPDWATLTATSTATATPKPLPPAPRPGTGFWTELVPGVAQATINGVSNFYALQAKAANVDLVRYNGVLWSDVERTAPTDDKQHTYLTDQLAMPDADLQALADQGIPVAVVLRGTPQWAVDPAIRTEMTQFGIDPNFDTRCLPMAADHYANFALFTQWTIQHYRELLGTRYNIQAWELWNEPDAARQSLYGSTNQPFGCWGDTDDTRYYGGEAYGQMLAVVARAIRAADPQAQVWFGGMMLTGDDIDPSGGGTDPNRTGRFFEGALHALYPDGRYDPGVDERAFDLVPFHAYIVHTEPSFLSSTRDWEAWQWNWRALAWEPRPLSVGNKARYLRQRLERYNLDTPLAVNEGAYQLWSGPPDAAFLDFHANYLARYYVRASALDLAGATWFNLNYNGWRETDLFNSDHTPRLAYRTLQLLATHLSAATFQGVERDGLVEWHVFTKGTTEYRVYWTNDTAATATVPFNTIGRHITVFNKAGDVLQQIDQPAGSAPTALGITVTFDPVLVIIEPDPNAAMTTPTTTTPIATSTAMATNTASPIATPTMTGTATNTTSATNTATTSPTPTNTATRLPLAPGAPSQTATPDASTPVRQHRMFLPSVER